MPENMAIAAKKYTTTGSLSVVCILSVLAEPASSSGEVDELGAGRRRLANCVGDGTYVNETNHSTVHTTAPPSAAPVYPRARATSGKHSPAKSCEACTPDCLTPIQSVRLWCGTARMITRLVVGFEMA